MYPSTTIYWKEGFLLSETHLRLCRSVSVFGSRFVSAHIRDKNIIDKKMRGAQTLFVRNQVNYRQALYRNREDPAWLHSYVPAINPRIVRLLQAGFIRYCIESMRGSPNSDPVLQPIVFS